MNVSLTPKLEKIIKQKIDSGLYASANEVVRKALHLLDEYDLRRENSLAELRQCIEDGINSGPATPLDMEEVIATAKKNWRGNSRY